MRPDQVPPLLEFAAAYSRRLIVVVAAAVVAGYVTVQLSAVVLPVLIALLLAALLAAPAEWLRRRGVPNALAATLVVLGTVAAVVGLLGIVGPAALSEFDDVAAAAREGVGRLSTYLVEGPFGLSEAAIDRRIESVVDQARANAGGLAGRALSGALLALNALAGLVLTLILLFFFIKDGQRIADWLVGLTRPEWRSGARELASRAFDVLAAYARSVVVVAVVDAALIALALVVIGVPLVVPLAVLTFFGAFFPLIGAVVAGAVAVLVALVSDGVTAAALVLVAILLIQQVEGNLLYPVVVGKSLALHPVATLLALTAGTVLAGVVGALFAVPLAAVASVCGSYLRDRVGTQRQAVGAEP